MHRFAVFLYPGFSTITFGITTALELANFKLGFDAYQVSLVSEHGGPVATSLGYEIQTTCFKRRQFDTIMIASEMAIPVASPGMIRYLQSVDIEKKRVASTCTGSFILASAGLLDGRRATTHWHYAKKLQDDFPKIKVEADRIYRKDGPIWTSAGMTAGIDLALAMIEEDQGVELARLIAKLMVVYHRRAGGQSQYSTLLDLSANSDRIHAALDYARKNLTARLSVDDLAAVAYLSPRQFSRLFLEETGQTPAKAVERLRVEAARLMMEDGRFSADEVAQQNGFGNRDRMRRSFIRAFGQSARELQRMIP